MSPLQAPYDRSDEEVEKHSHGVTVTEDVDTGAALVAGISGGLDPVEVARVRYVFFDFFHHRLIICKIEGRLISASY
ncbi:hypothetical protein M405DRAFT_55310 [Rhizopogon salebrosus TDB-379]|nr:hypothetical protein M405DRAFT_55310 [Rhizopogon salebrosus TDB-379]